MPVTAVIFARNTGFFAFFPPIRRYRRKISVKVSTRDNNEKQNRVGLNEQVVEQKNKNQVEAVELGNHNTLLDFLH